MQSFEENCCRLCSKRFCCVRCRCNHEETIHNVNSECEICIYGRTTIKQASVSLLSHIKSAHWPLHCVFCKKVFTSLDELLPHDKCTFKLENTKMQGTPKTPDTPANDSNNPSPEVTPFYKNVKIQQAGTTMAVTSTPLIHKDDKITPTNNKSEICCPYKSNLKLTGSSNLSDSKKSERRVTFSETPPVLELTNKPKHLPLTEKINDESIKELHEDSSDDSYASVDEIFKTAPSYTEEKENVNNEILTSDKKFNLNGTLWESALNNIDLTSTSNESSNKSNHFNVSLQINVINNTIKSEDSNFSNLKEAENVSVCNKSIWTSMTNMVKSVVNNLSMTAQNNLSSVGVKRSQPENDGAPSLKRMKLTDIKCRRPIRDISSTYLLQLATKPRYVDKATQTEDIWT